MHKQSSTEEKSEDPFTNNGTMNIEQEGTNEEESDKTEYRKDLISNFSLGIYTSNKGYRINQWSDVQSHFQEKCDSKYSKNISENSASTYT